MDIVTLSVLKGRLEEIAEEMDVTLFRSAFNPVIAEARDACHGLYDPETGDTVIQGKKGMPVFVGVMAFAVKAVMNKIAELGGTQDGDVFLLNDPYLGGTHLNDVKLIRPVFVGERLLCFLASSGHWNDVGGNVPGNFNAASTETYQEGVLVPPIRLVEAGRLQQDMVAMLMALSRTPTNCYGDLHGQINALSLGVERVRELAKDYGVEALLEAFKQLRDRASLLTRSAIAELPDGVYSYEDYMDNDGIEDAPIRIAVDITIAGEEATFDFSRTSSAVTGPLNISYPTTVAGCYIAIKHLFPDVYANSGCLEPVRIVVPEDSLLNAKHPRPVCGYTETVERVVEVIFGAIALAAPQLSNGLPHGTINALSLSGRRTGGSGWVLFMFFGGGLGGNPQTDGLNYGSPPIGTATVPPAEIIEARYPVMFTQWALRPDSCGAGRHRGGLGAVIEIELLAEQAVFSHFGERSRSAPHGVAGGGDAALNVVLYEQDGGFRRPPMGAKVVGVRLKKGERVRMEMPGGGGYGPAAERAPEKIQRDIALGYITREAALRDYGVVGASAVMAFEQAVPK